MYVSLTAIRVPPAQMQTMTRLLETHYLSKARHQPGFIRAYLLEQIDDPNRAQLVQVWNSQADLETFRQSGVSDEANRVLHRQIPGLQMQTQGYVVRMQPGDSLPPV